jgi:YesN/AraC family two-component response regulator
MEINYTNELKFFASALNILIVEDDKELNESLKNLLETFFKTVDVAKDGIDALNKYKLNRYDIVLTDINMPRMNGIELAKEIRILNYEQCILVLSAYIDDFVIDLIDIGIQGLILKPFETNKFIMTLCRNCENILMKKEFKRSELILKNKIKPSINILEKKIGIENLIEKKVDFDLKKKINVPEISISNTLHSWEIIEDDIKDYNFEMSEIIDYIMLHGINEEYLELLSNVFRKYHSSFTLLDDMDHFSAIFEELADFFGSLDLSKIPKDKLKDFDAYLYIYDDLLNFFDIVFIKKECKNINYLTDSLKSSVNQMKHVLTQNKLEEEELELF